jgi:hypothetical protein
MAPEAVKQGAVKLGRSSDIWSLGIILYQMVYRQAPFAHLEPMQRIFALTQGTPLNFPSGHRFEGHSEQTKAVLINVLEQCLQREPRRRPSISELLQHPFLHDAMHLTRCTFDRTFQALISGFCEATRNIMDDKGSEPACADDGADSDIDFPGHDQWQLLADQMWDLLSKDLNGRSCVRSRHLAGAENQRAGDVCPASLGLVPFGKVLRHWIERGNRKRQRTDRQNVEHSHAPSMVARQPLVSRPQIVPNQLPPPHQKAANVLDRSGIDADLLQQQRACLKKTIPVERSNKENSAPHGDSGYKMSEDVSLALRRLKDRRRVVADERTEELTSTTKWIQ